MEDIPQAPVSFEEDRTIPASHVGVQKSSFTTWLIANSGGILKNEKEASIALLVCAGIGIVLSLVLTISAFSTPKPPPANQIIDVAGPNARLP